MQAPVDFVLMQDALLEIRKCVAFTDTVNSSVVAD